MDPAPAFEWLNMGSESALSPAEAGAAEPLHLGHQPRLEKLLHAVGDGLSEYCFSNLYLFRHVHDYKVLAHELPCISGKTYDGHRYLMPLFDLSTVPHASLLALMDGHDFFFPVSEPAMAQLDRIRFQASFNDDDSDYLYGVDKLSSYRGTKLGKKRNLMKQFLARHEPRWEMFRTELAEDAREILEQWQADKGKAPQETDYCPCQEAIRLSEPLGLKGLITYAGSDPAGFLLAKEVHPGVLAIHFAKGKDRYVGVFQYMFNRFASHFREGTRFINFEQDLGNRNFRQTKRSYCPDRLLPKYRVRPLG